jgi:hypothetical protein
LPTLAIPVHKASFIAQCGTGGMVIKIYFV